MNHEYELMVLARSDLNEETRYQLIDQIKKVIEAGKGEIVSASDWGKRELAYEIKKNTHGFYTLITFCANSRLPSILNSKLKLMEELLRFLVVRREGKNSTRKHAALLG
ncbi:MAG: 30S ribosomal protein S6 [Candidatus Woykebacteria bacterium GWB1_45_5]|uniref:Small ribosomal subunit protein bS6 n=2 Tax=Candidatus Woykeibacteriota TaxID=1817899 RepID=A0A1G1W330_9BACT|nr:MAG: 30S ribosomal protein S6 [Candidatus Woykebacteria bacterium GWA1_44_8]OGY23939.1 MAG: 30S ribosomal protein S6 [Candidatus Woykebacteria bacterium GWB1_45_5]